MAKLRINGDSSGYVDLSAPNAASSSTLDLDQVPQKNAAATTFTGNLGLGAAPNIGSSSGTAILTLTNSGTNRAVLEMGSTTAMSGGIYAQEAYYNGGVLSTLTQHGAEGANSGYTKFFTKASSGSITEKMRIHGAGYVTTPQQPGFSYLGSKSHDIETTGTVVMTSANVWSASVNHAFNRGSHFSASTGRFTAPVAGTYHFQFQCMAASFSSGYLWFYMGINGTTKSYMQMPQQAELNAITHHMYCELAVGDYVNCSWTNNYNSGFIHYPGFSGYLVG